MYVDGGANKWLQRMPEQLTPFAIEHQASITPNYLLRLINEAIFGTGREKRSCEARVKKVLHASLAVLISQQRVNPC